MGGNTPPRPPPPIVENERPGAGQVRENVKLYQCVSYKEEDIFHLLISCEKLVDIWKLVKTIHNEIGIFNLKPVHQVIGFIDSADRVNLPNMILSETRWQIWKYRCTNKYDRKGNILPLLDLLKLRLKQNVIVLLKSKQCEKLKNELEKIIEFL